MDLLTTELQQYIEKIINKRSAASKAISQAYQDAVAPLSKSLAVSNEIQAVISRTHSDAAVANEALIKTLSEAMIPLSKSIAISNKIQEAVSKSQSAAFETVKSLSQSIDRIAVVNDAFSNSASSLINTPPDDCVTIDKDALHEIDIPNELVLPIGNFRIKIPTGVFISIVEMVVTLILTFILSFGGNDNSASIDIQESSQIIIEEKQVLIDLLDSVDPSESSQADLIINWKESFLAEDD